MVGPYAGGGDGKPGASNTRGDAGAAGTGGGGGGTGYNSGTNVGGAHGGSGVAILRYQIGTITAQQKATGGAISYYGGKTIHTFTGSGTFATTSDWSAANVEYVVIGGGGAGGWGTGDDGHGGGGAGAYRTEQHQ